MPRRSESAGEEPAGSHAAVPRRSGRCDTAGRRPARREPPPRISACPQFAPRNGRGKPQVSGMFVIPDRPHDLVMTTEYTNQNKQLVSDFIQDLFTKGDLDGVNRYLAPNFVNHDAPFPGTPD